MTDITRPDASVVYGAFDGHRAATASLGSAEAASTATILPMPAAPAAQPSDGDGPPKRPAPPVPGISGPGRARMNAHTLRRLREARMLSQEDLAYEFERRKIQISIATIKRAETWHQVRFRIVRGFAEFYGVSFEDLLS